MGFCIFKMKSYKSKLDLKNTKGNFIPVLLERGSFPIKEECTIDFNENPFHINQYFWNIGNLDENREQSKITEHVYKLFSYRDLQQALIAIRFVKSPRDTQYLFLNELQTPKGEINFGYLIFRLSSLGIQIRDYNSEEPLSKDNLQEDYGHRNYRKDLDLTTLVLDTLAQIGREVYGQRRLVNAYTYESDKPLFLQNGFEEIEDPSGKLWVREI